MFKNVCCASLLAMALGCGDDDGPGAEGDAQEQDEDEEQDEPRECSEIGCRDQLVIKLNHNDGEWGEGSYELFLTIDGQAHECSFAFSLGRPRADEQPSCTPPAGLAQAQPVELSLEPFTGCVERIEGDAGTGTCQPNGGRYTVQITVPGTPPGVQVQLSLFQGDVGYIHERKYVPSYEETRPNGPACEPVCRQGILEDDV